MSQLLALDVCLCDAFT
ncbi:DUF645 family protein [Vibrio cholerae]|nr:DUF645 family protein [Vibrio cholerae]EGR1402928.1 DUF645 family protein [Vibrio cholerae]EGR1429554.1 DUF645 family protein [Vibrio cholerae]EJL6681090.1 DUF645 family protein [Vibrio cholerae]EKF9303261.1 DUF645 family protein [Vibrio cholerae]